MDQPTSTSRYLPGLDGLRAVAILGIVLYHMFPGAVRGGYLGVTMFFVLSGYLLSRTGSAALAQGRWRTLGFWQKRVRRIYPALLWVLALTLIALRLWLPEGDWVHLWSGERFTGGWVEVPAPLGEPPVFFRSASAFAALFRELKSIC